MTDTPAISDHWGKGDVYSRILDTMELAGIDPNSVTVEQLAPVDHFHARGFPATVELADVLPIKEGDCLIDIGCGLGGPARYLAKRFKCDIDGIDITAPFVDAANKLSVLVGMEGAVECRHGDGQKLPYGDETFDGGFTQILAWLRWGWEHGFSTEVWTGSLETLLSMSFARTATCVYC